MMTLFDDYEVPEGIELHDPSPPSTLRMVFKGRQLLGQVQQAGQRVRVIARMGDYSPRTFASVQAAVAHVMENPNASR
jgi:hypothetical protein